MSRELIVSMNGREKKIAIVENERVTEFYIERGSEDQGIVGNLYKGRVMRVLPGMQSAFVDIGLERDAFLYVSDFFEDHDEYDRVVSTVEEKVLRLEKEGAAAPATEPSGESSGGEVVPITLSAPAQEPRRDDRPPRDDRGNRDGN